MPITNYAAQAEKARVRLFADPLISDANKAAVRKYLLQYKVKPATKQKFLTHVQHILRDTKDITKEMHSRDRINRIFSKYSKKYKQVQYQMLASCSKQLVKWLNEGAVPKGFLDIQLKKKQLRNLEREDMFTWDEILNIVNHADEPMLKAIIAVQADAGLRPSEFMDLKYKDIEIDKEDASYINIFVRDGKTGKRDVPCIRCTGFITAWLNVHPTKKPNDYLWVREFKDKIIPYTYNAIRLKLKYLCERLKIRKPYDFYSLRHTSCYLDKIERVDPDVAADRHGHSVSHFLYVYGRLDKDDKMNMFKKTTGGKEAGTKPGEYGILTCFRCSTANNNTEDYCLKCGSPLRVDVAIKSGESTKKKLKDMEKQMKELSDALIVLKGKGILK